MSCPGDRQKTHVIVEVGGCPWLSTVGAAFVGGLKGGEVEGGRGEYIVSNFFPVEVSPLRLFVSFARPSPLEERLSASSQKLCFSSSLLVRLWLVGPVCCLPVLTINDTLVASSFDSAPVDDSHRDDDKRTRPPHISHPTWFALPPGSPEKDVADSRTPSFRRSPPPTRLV